MSDEVQEREVARRVFAAEFDDATLSYSESDEERAPNYVVTPTGARVNRLFGVGALTEVEQVNDDVLRGRIADPTGVFVTYGGQYQPDAAAFLERATPPCFVAITGKGRTYQPDDSDRIFTSVRPESLTEVDADTRDRWVVAAAEATLDRIATMAAALDVEARGDDLRTELESRGVDAALASGVTLALDHYRPTEQYLESVRTLAVQSLELVAGDRETVETLDVAPDESGPAQPGSLPDVPAASPAPAAVTRSGDATADSDVVTGSGDTVVDSGGTVEPADATPDPVDTDTESPAVDGADSGPAADPGAGESATADAADNTSTADTTRDTMSEAVPTEEPSTDAAGDPPSVDTAAATGSESTESPATDPETSVPTDDVVDTATGSGDGSDDLGDFGVGDGPDGSEMYELDEAERAEIESEYGTEFATGNEVDSPGEADIDVPDVEDLEAEAATATGADAPTADGDPASSSGPESGLGVSSESESDPDPTTDPGGAASPTSTGSGATDVDGIDGGAGASDDTPDGTDADDVDLEAAAVDVMNDLDGGDGADREAVVSTVVDEYGVAPDAVESAIQDALMGGKCYEPGEGRLKAI
jgi:RPA family protein